MRGQWSRFFRRVGRWLRRRRERRRARLGSLRHADEQLVDFSHELRDSGESYDTWRRTLPVPRRGGGMGL